MLPGNSVFFAALLACTAVGGVSTFKIVGPSIESKYITEPVTSLAFPEEGFECIGRDVLAVGVLDKAIWPDGSEAEFLGLTLLSDEAVPRRLAWRRPDENDRSPASRPAGLQGIELYIEDGCDTPFFAHTKHASPWSGLVMRMKFGPFQADD